MKKILYTIVAVVALCSVASCEKFLTTEPLDRQSSAGFPSSEAEAEQLVTSIYGSMLYVSPETSTQLYLAQLASDECLGGNVPANANIAHSLMKYSSSTNDFQPMWRRLYTMINKANATLEILSSWDGFKDKELQKRLIAETHFLRGYAYWELALSFGEVPIHLTNDGVNAKRASIDRVYGVIAHEIREAINTLPNAIYPAGHPLEGHATKAAAQALQARIFLFYTGRYDKTELPAMTDEEGKTVEGSAPVTKSMVITDIDDCIANSGHALISDQRNLWPYSAEILNKNKIGVTYKYAVENELKWAGNGCIETVFAEKHNLTAISGATECFSNTLAAFFTPPKGSRTYSEATVQYSYPFSEGWGQGPVAPNMVEDWLAWESAQGKKDPRLTGSVWATEIRHPDGFPNGEVLIDKRMDPNEAGYSVASIYYEQTGYYQKKLIVVGCWNDEAGKWNQTFMPVLYPGLTTRDHFCYTNATDVILIRFADVLLMQSELKQDVTGINLVRERSGLDPIASYSLEALQNERRYELCFESQRWYDLLRWSGPSLEYAGQMLNKKNGFKIVNEAKVVDMPYYDYAARLKETQGYWPIPQDEIDKSEGQLTQNPGWDSPNAAFKGWNAI
ncbi:MAG: RagB/SusD family nutrient uptake outer membrane protein [Bacteroidales bacterium]|nr:RagB/SusD family nutrient uptake outer membrane protein [Candidatus Cacconaster merdequi]